MSSLRSRLIALWVMLAASALVTAFLLLQFYRQSANVQVAQALSPLARTRTLARPFGQWLALAVSQRVRQQAPRSPKTVNQGPAISS